MDQSDVPNVDDPSANANTLFAWLEQQPEGQSQELVETLFVQLLEQSAKSRVSSVNACAKLCGFVQHCAKTNTRPPVTAWAFRETTALRLFHFYIEWNEKDQHRSLKLVLDLAALLVLQNPDAAAKAAVRAEILRTLVAIISHKSTRPLVKSSIGSLHYLLGKGVYQYEEVAQAYSREAGLADDGDGNSSTDTRPGLDTWKHFVTDMFAWMTLHYVCPVAGKLLVAVFAYLRTAIDGDGKTLFAGFTVELWLQWLRDGLSAHPGILEDVKLYFFIPLFKADRASSLQLLEVLNRQETSGTANTHNNSNAGSLDVHNAAILQLAALEVGKKSGLVDDPGLNLTGKEFKGIVLNENVLDNVLAQASSDVRSLALSLLVSSQSTTKPYSPTAFALLKKYLPTYHAESDAKFRYELLAHTRDMAVRLKSALAIMRRRPQNPTDDPVETQAKTKTKANAMSINREAVKTALDEHEFFLTWYLSFLREELAPTASYQRHFTSLKATSWLFRQRRDVSGGVSDALDLNLARRFFQDYAWIRCVLDLIMDPFDDVRETATSLLMLVPQDIVMAPLFPPTSSGSQWMPTASTLWDVLVQFSMRSDLRASQTARQDHADGAARCQGLLCSWAHDLSARQAIISSVLDTLEDKIDKAESDLGTAAVQFPVHGEFAAIRYIWTVLDKARYSSDDLLALIAVQVRVVQSCVRIWNIVKHVLCDDSPEGHMPEEMEDAIGLDSKDLLSYSFRSINESSNTMRAFIKCLRFSRVEGTLRPDRTVFETIGNLTFEQLSTLRHRGALTTVAQTFTLSCQMVREPVITEPGTPDNKTLIVKWYKGTLDCIQSQVSTTRRSAGIPSLFSGILASGASSPTFEEAIWTACEIAQRPAHVRETDGSRLPQVHAFNCLRDVFRSSLLSKRAERLLPECLQLAANSLRSEVWAIRNCALLLLRSLIDCLFGTGESKSSLESGWDGRTIRVSYNKYPTLPGVLLRLLQSDSTVSSTAKTYLQIESQKAAAESVFPALDIIRRAGAPETHRDELYSAVVQYLGSRLWHVREMAARTVCSFLIVQDWVAGIKRLLLDKEAVMSANHLHGTFLAFRFVVVRVAEIARETVPGKLPEVLALLDAMARSNDGFTSCPDVRAAYLEARNTVVSLALDFDIVLETVALEAESTAASDSTATSLCALLRAQTALQANYDALTRHDRGAVEVLLGRITVSDPDAATRLLDAVATSWFTGVRRTSDVASWLSAVYSDIGMQSAAAPLVRATALRHLADAMDFLLTTGHDKDSTLLPGADTLLRLWAVTGAGEISPALSWAILRVSGPIMAAAVASTIDSLPFSVSSWAAMMQSACNVNQTFDTRMAAAEALRSFSLAGAAGTFDLSALADNDLLPLVSCVYDVLNDDDDEIRDVAAEAAGAVLKTPLIPGEAARQFPLWMDDKFGRTQAAVLSSQAAARMEGQTTTVRQWPSAATLLSAALEFDDALFLVEEQNLFIDEVREVQRWADVLQKQGDVDGTFATWLADGLEVLVARLQNPDGDDGPLGWTAAPRVFAVCARLIIGARALVQGSGDHSTTDRLTALLKSVQQAGKAARLHGLLLVMAEV